MPPTAPVLETDAPDIPPHWIYRTAAEREAALPSSQAQARNEPAELAGIARTLAELRGCTLDELAAQMRANSLAVMPKLAALL